MEKDGGGVCGADLSPEPPPTFTLTHPTPPHPRSFPYIEMRPQYLNFPGAVVRAEEGAHVTTADLTPCTPSPRQSAPVSGHRVCVRVCVLRCAQRIKVLSAKL